MRAEFTAISAAFNLLPTLAGNAGQAVVINGGGTGMTVTVGTLALAGDLTTTGAFNTVLAQQGSFSFTLPSAPGTLAMLSDVASSVLVETARAEAAESTLTTAISSETTARIAGDAAEASARTTAIGVETTRAETAEALLAPKASPALTGTPTAPTAAALTNTTQLATTAFTTAGIGVETARAEAAEALLAPKASPALTGAPTAPTAAALTSTTQLATTAFTTAAVATETARAEAAEATLGAFAAIHGVNASRSFGTNFTNSTGKPMFLAVLLNSGTSYSAALLVDGFVQIETAAGIGVSYLAFVLHPGAVYQVALATGTATLSEWTETW